MGELYPNQYFGIDIWKHKARIDNPVLAEGDGPIYQLREWYSQFFMDEADIPAKLKERQEIVTMEKQES